LSDCQRRLSAVSSLSICPPGITQHARMMLQPLPVGRAVCGQRTHPFADLQPQPFGGSAEDSRTIYFMVYAQVTRVLWL